MRNWATGVTIVTAAQNGERHGMTVSSFTSLSLTPPLVMVSLERVAKTHQLVSMSGYFAVTILGTDQREISDLFAGRYTEEVDRFKGLDVFTLVSGAPLIANGLSFFDCRVVSTYPAGTHTLFIGEVLEVNQGDGKPLLYYQQDYHHLTRHRDG